MTVDLIFWIAALFGTGLLLISFIVGEVLEGVSGFFSDAIEGLADALHFDFDATPDIAGVAGGPHALNGPTIFAFTTLFGWGGILARSFGLGALGSSAVGLMSGLAAAVLIYGFYRLLYNQQSDSSYQISDLIGRAGECTVNIVPGSMGQVHVLFKGSGRYVTARSAQTINAGETVVIKKATGNIVEVAKEDS